MSARTGTDFQLEWHRMEQGSAQQESKATSSQDRRLNRLLETVTREVKLYAEEQITRIKRLNQIGLALSSERDVGKILEMIVAEARALTRADAGTLYTLRRDRKLLEFEILQNDTLEHHLGKAGVTAIALPSIPLFVEDKPNHHNVSSHVALTGEVLNIPDVYNTEDFDFSGTTQYDARTGYRSQSMLVMPLRNHEGDVIGILQLLNALHPDTGGVIPFSEQYVEYVAGLASQAAVALTNAQLIADLQNLFTAFIRSIATAVDEKSSYTGGHIKRVVDLTTMIARKINETTRGPLAEVQLSEDEMEELRMAAWMHDIGKITTPGHVIDKSTKLETIFDRIHLVNTRFDCIAQTIRNRYLRERLKLVEKEAASLAALQQLNSRLDKELKALQEDREFIAACNIPWEPMNSEKVERLKEIGSKTYEMDGKRHRYLTSDEVTNLCVLKGTLTAKERKIIEHHTVMTLRILRELPFPKKLARIPEYASSHHEKVDGSGYPFGLAGERLPIQVRIMAIADIFEALTAKDRPYKRPLKLSQAMKILGFMKNDHLIDPDIYDLFVESQLYRDYARRELSAEQFDET